MLATAFKRVAFLLACLAVSIAITIGASWYHNHGYFGPSLAVMWYALRANAFGPPLLVTALVGAGIAGLFNRRAWLMIVGVPIGIGVGLVAGYASFIVIALSVW